MDLKLRILLMALALALLFASGTSLRWMTLDREAIAAERTLERSYAGQADDAELKAARARLDEVIEARPHPTYLDRQARIEFELGSRLRNADPVTAFASLRRAEELAVAAHEQRPGLPHSLMRAAAARAERFEVDAQFEAYLREAYQLGPFDGGILRSSLLLTLQHWPHASASLRAFILDQTEQAFAASQGDGLAALIGRANGWAEFCRRPVIREHNPRPCRDFEPAG